MRAKVILLILCLSSWTIAQSKVGIMIQTDTSVEKKCVSMPGDASSVMQLTQKTFPSEASPDGAICKLMDTGCPGSNCFCNCSLVDCYYWALFTKRAGEKDWTYAKKGPVQTQVHAGDMVAWVWTQGNMRVTKTKPAPTLGEDLCADKK